MRKLIALARQYLELLFSSHPFPIRALTGFAIALVVILGALGSQYVGGILPCELCLLQRWPYYLGVPLLALVLALWKWIPVPLRIGLTAIATLIFIVSIGLAVYHVGVQWKFWPGPSSCTGPGVAIDFNQISNLSAVEVVPCDAIDFSLFGLTMAGYNAIASAVISFLLGWSVLGQFQRMKSK